MRKVSAKSAAGNGEPSRQETPFTGPQGLVPEKGRHRLWEFLLLSFAALSCIVLGAWLDALLQPTSVGRLSLGLAAFAGYLLLGRKALMALVPGLDRRWRRDGRDRMSQTHLTKNADKG